MYSLQTKHSNMIVLAPGLSMMSWLIKNILGIELESTLFGTDLVGST